MSSNVANQVAFLRTSREFPEELHQLSVELTKSYIDIANVVNNRIIGIFSTNVPAVTGESWFITNNRQQTLRRFFTATTTTSIAHGLKNTYNNIPYFTRIWGQYTDGTNWYGLIPGSTTAITGQISCYLDNNNINFVVDGAAPSVTKLVVVIEWMSNV